MLAADNSSGRFIEDFSQFILQRVPTSEDWATSIATTVFSATVCQDRYAITSIGRLPLNLWYLYIGPSGIAYKSSPFKAVVEPLFDTMELKSGKNLLIPSKGSIEGFIDYFQTKQNFGILVKDEFTSAIKESGKDYLADIMEFYSELYDGRVSGRFTRKVQYERSQKVFISCLAATTPYIYKILKPEFFVQGLGNRLLLLIHDIDSTSKLTEEEMYGATATDTINFQNKIVEFSDSLARAKSSPIRELFLAGEVLDMVVDYARRNTMQLKALYKKDPNDLTATYMQRMTAHVLKLAAIKTLSDRYLDIPNTRLEDLMITSSALEWAFDRSVVHVEEFKTMLDQWRTTSRPATLQTLDEPINHVHGIISSYVNGVTWSELRNIVPKWYRSMLLEIMNNLFDTKKIVVFKMRAVGPGRPPIRVFNRSSVPTMTSTEGEQITSWEMFRTRIS